jgi:hypothetical protein
MQQTQHDELPQYRCHKIVNAARITAKEWDAGFDELRLIFGDIGRYILVDKTWLKRHGPIHVNGYYVVYEDGYRSYSPKRQFESGYTSMKMNLVKPERPVIISGFPGIGKSNLVKRYPAFADSDSSTFDKADFPANYMTHIKGMIAAGKSVMVSSHDVVRSALLENDLRYTLVYPAVRLKDEYMERYRERGSPEAFLKLMDENWEKFINQCATQNGCLHYVLSNGEYLTDAFPSIYDRAVAAHFLN